MKGMDDGKSALTLLLVDRLLSGVRGVAAQHLLILAHTDTLALHHLQVLQAAEDFIVHLEQDLDVEFGALLNGKWLLLQGVDSAGGGQVDSNVGAAINNERERLDDTVGITGLANWLALVQTKGGLPADHGLIIGICMGGHSVR